MTQQTAGFSPQTYARTGGFLYLYIIAAGIFAQAFVRGRMIVPGDASATADNILAAETLFRLGFASEILLLMCDIGVALILYVLLKPVSRNIALLAALFRLVMAAVSGVNSLNHYAVLNFLDGADYLSVFDPAQLEGLAYLSLKAHAAGYVIALVFFGFHCLFLGLLLFKASYFPKILGLLIFVAGACYLINSFASIIAPDIAAMISPQILLPCLVGELALALWLVIRGGNLERWHRASILAAPLR